MLRRCSKFSVTILVAVLARSVLADEVGAESRGASDPSGGLPNVTSPTWGGKQFWADELHFRGWRIQRQAITNHYRLLDEDDRRYAWGSFDSCRQTLERIKRERQLPPMQDRAVILVHGITRTRSMMKPMAEYLERETGDQVLRFGYPSTREGIDEHARSLARVIENLDSIDQIDLVAHSLGNIVIRRYLAGDSEGENQRRPDQRIHRIVMLTPPNQGSRRGALWDESRWAGVLYRAVLGEAGHELAIDWPNTATRLAVPDCEFGILAGGRGDGDGWHDLLPGDDDGTVSVEETKLARARDFLVLPIKHSAFPSDPQVMQCTLRFLRQGCFVAPDLRRPIQEAEMTAERIDRRRRL
jgi:pimeloyl-ACP methyl ester carboxylesterase